MLQRIQKFLSNQGIASRRTIESWINSKRLKVNGIVALLGMQINGTEKFTLDEQNLPINYLNQTAKIYNCHKETKLLLYYKPIGSICSNKDPFYNRTVFADLPKIHNGRWISIGRLDLNTSGLLLFTNNGQLAHRLMHPSFNQEREYLVRTYGKILTLQQLTLFKEGILLNDGIAKFKNINLLNKHMQQKSNHFNPLNNWYQIILTEGKNKEIRRLFATQNLIVNRLIRIRYGNILLPKNLKPRQYQYVDLELYKSHLNALS